MNQSNPLNQKFNLLQKVIDESHIHLIMDKMLEEVKYKHKKKIEIYNNDLQKFEIQYGMKSSSFYEKFEKGLIGDEMDYFEWSGLIELRDSLLKKVKMMEMEN